MGRGAPPACPEDELTLLDLLENSGNYVVHRVPVQSQNTAAALRPKRPSRSRRGRNAPAGEDRNQLKLLYQLKLRHVSARGSALLDADAREDISGSQARQRTDGAAVMHGNEPDAANSVVVVEAVHTEEDIIAPAPGVMSTGHRRKAPKATLDDAGIDQPGSKRRRQGKAPLPEAPVGIPSPITGPIAPCAAIFQVPQEAAMENRSMDWQHLPSEMAQPERDRAEAPVDHDAFANVSLEDLNDLLEKRLHRQFMPEFVPQEGATKPAIMKQFTNEYLQNRVEQFRALLRQNRLVLAAHKQIAESLSNLGDLKNLPPSAIPTFREERPSLVALKRLCRKAPQLAEQQVKFAAVMKEFHDATSLFKAGPQVERQLFTREEMEAGKKQAADDRETEVREAFAARAALAPEPADEAMLPLSPDLLAEYSTNDSQRDAAIQAIAYTLAPAHRLTEKAANIEEVLFDSYGENGKAGSKYWARLKALVVKMCPETHETIWETTYGVHGNPAAAADRSSASATGHSAAEAVDMQHLDALQSDQAAADSTRGKIWEGSMPVLDFATRS